MEANKILEHCGYPANAIVLDFETYYDTDYKASSRNMSIVEYVMDDRFDILGMAFQWVGGDGRFLSQCEVSDFIATLDFTATTVVAHNAMFDGLILVEKFNRPIPYCVDTLGLSRFQEARAEGAKVQASNSLAKCAERYGLTAKGSLEFAKGKHWYELTGYEKLKLASYARNDVKITADLLGIVLPLLTRPKQELAIMQDLLDRFWYPALEFDTERAIKLRADMEACIDGKIAEVDWI